jgi:hypothetical protein
MYVNIMALVLVVGAVGADPSTKLYSNTGTLAPDKQTITPLAITSHDRLLTVDVAGSGKGGDLDCYLLVKGEKDWHVLLLDESAWNGCYLSAYIHTDDPIKLWVVNHGTAATTFAITVQQ